MSERKAKILINILKINEIRRQQNKWRNKKWFYTPKLHRLCVCVWYGKSLYCCNINKQNKFIIFQADRVALFFVNI